MTTFTIGLAIIGMAGILLIFLISFSLMMHKNRIDSIDWRLHAILSVIAIFFLFFPILGIANLSRMENIKKKQSTIMSLSAINEGIYHVQGTYLGPDGNWLAILEKAKITAVETNKEPKVVSWIPIGDTTIQLVNIEKPISSPQYNPDGTYTGLAIVSKNNTNKFIRDYNPIKEFKK